MKNIILIKLIVITEFVYRQLIYLLSKYMNYIKENTTELISKI